MHPNRNINEENIVVSLRNLHRSFDGRKVLKGLSLDFPRGLTTVVMGPSGCGKSVMMKHMIGLLKPNSGEVFFNSERVDQLKERELSAIRRRFGMLFQQAALFDSMNVHDNVAFPMHEATAQLHWDQVPRPAQA